MAATGGRHLVLCGVRLVVGINGEETMKLCDEDRTILGLLVLFLILMAACGIVRLLAELLVRFFYG